MSTSARPHPFASVNPHALATILEASQTKRIIASRDIFDLGGTKLWARDLPVSQSLQRKLIDRQLRHPLESCLQAEDGVSTHTLVRALDALLAQDSPLSSLLRPSAEKIVRTAAQLPLHSVAQLLLTAGQAARPDSFQHAVQAMALAGSLMAAHGGGPQEMRLAMLGGLLHDLGEMYIAPEFGEAEAERELDFVSYQQLVVHPHVGSLLLTQLTDYPAVLAQAVAEHHERLDGSGYPHALQRAQVSPLGRLLAVTEATLGALRGAHSHLARVSIALRVVPGEFDLHWVGRIAHASRSQPTLQPTLTAESIQARLAHLDAAMRAADIGISEALRGEQVPALKNGLDLAQHLLGRLRTGWNASGLWIHDAVVSQDASEVEAVEQELMFRLRGVERALRLRAADLPPDAAARLERLCVDCLGSAGRH